MLPAILLPDLYDIEAIGHELLEYALASETGARDRDLKNPVSNQKGWKESKIRRRNTNTHCRSRWIEKQHL